MPASATTDHQQLLERARAGDAEALESLLESVQPQLYRFSLKMCRHAEDAEDVLQDSMLTLARSFRDFRGASSLSTWLYSIARSICIKKRRKSKFAPAREESLEGIAPDGADSLVTTAAGPEEQVEALEVWEQVQRGIQALEPEFREVLVLRDVEGLTAKEVAEVTGGSVSAVKSRLHRARARLREHLSSERQSPHPGCPDIVDTFSRYLEGELSASVCATMQAHVAECTACSAQCDGLKQTLHECSAAPARLPPGLEERLRDALRRALATSEK